MNVTEDGLPVTDVTYITSLLDEVRDAYENAMAKLPKTSGERWRLAQARTLINEALNHTNLILPQECA